MASSDATTVIRNVRRDFCDLCDELCGDDSDCFSDDDCDALCGAYDAESVNPATFCDVESSL